MTETFTVSSEHEREVRAAVQRRRTLFGEVYLEVLAQALADISECCGAENLATARWFLLDPDSVVPTICELLAIDYQRLRRKALNRSARLEARRAALAAESRQRAREAKEAAA